MSASTIISLGQKVLSGSLLDYNEAWQLTQTNAEDIPLIMAYAHKIRHRFMGNQVDLCGIINARSGMCSEDCKFCSQSVFHRTTSSAYPLLSTSELVAAAKRVEDSGAKRVSLVTSGKGMEMDEDFPKILESLQAIIQQTSLQVCANLGTISPSQARQLAAIGIKRYAHNLETSEQFYSEICTTHPYSERIATALAAREAGLQLCTGGIIGLGESWHDRLSLALSLRELAVESVPLNILNPLPGTALEHIQPPQPIEILKTFAIFRFLLPSAIIRPAGGREINLRDFQGSVMLAGANGLIIGNYLTFTGRNIDSDRQLVIDAELNKGDYENDQL